jgi:hypothetical protein
MPEDTRKSFEGVKAKVDFLELAKRIQREQGISLEDAMIEARHEDWDAWLDWSNRRTGGRASGHSSKFEGPALDRYKRLWQQIKSEEGCSTQEAMRRAQDRFPQIYSDFLAACPVITEGRNGH